MQITTLTDTVYKTNNHLVVVDNHAILIDATANVADVEGALGNAQLKAILLTHTHFDHITTAHTLATHFNCPLVVHPAGQQALFSPKDNLSLKFSHPFSLPPTTLTTITSATLNYLPIPIKVYHTPGHSPCSVCYQIGNHLFTGDTLFSISPGRCDFFHSDEDAMKTSLLKLAALPPKDLYLAGHGYTFNHHRLQRVIDKYLA